MWKAILSIFVRRVNLLYDGAFNAKSLWNLHGCWMFLVIWLLRHWIIIVPWSSCREKEGSKQRHVSKSSARPNSFSYTPCKLYFQNVPFDPILAQTYADVTAEKRLVGVLSNGRNAERSVIAITVQPMSNLKQFGRCLNSLSIASKIRSAPLPTNRQDSLHTYQREPH